LGYLINQLTHILSLYAFTQKLVHLIPKPMTFINATPNMALAGTAFSSIGVAATHKIGFEKIKVALKVFYKDVSSHIIKPDYESKVSFITKFHHDFKIIFESMIPKRVGKVFVFIDDLDRCDVPKAADVMQALNLMIPEGGKTVFILGIDREKVAAGLAAKHERVLPFLYDGIPPKTKEFGSVYGMSFIEKFIQLPLFLPQPSLKDKDEYIEHILNIKNTLLADNEPKIVGTASPRAEEEEYLASQIFAGKEGRTIKGVIHMVTTTLEDNPRRIKQFVNAFRLKYLIARKMKIVV
jgi:hypothetical protein